MKIERELQSKIYSRISVDDAFTTLMITRQGKMTEVRGIQIRCAEHPRVILSVPEKKSVILPADEAFELARDIIRVHRGPSEISGTNSLKSDYVGFHAMSESEALMIEQVMLWDAEMDRIEFWQALRRPATAQKLLNLFVANIGDSRKFRALALEKLRG